MKKVVLMFIVLYSCVSFSGWLPSNTTITQITTRSDGGFVLTLSSNSGGCANSKMTALSGKNGMSQDGVKSALTVSLSAFSIGKEVNVAYQSDGGVCWISAITINQ